MSADARPVRVLEGWTPILAALSIWFVHFLVVYGAALIWPNGIVARLVAFGATIPALVALAILFVRLRAARPTGEQTGFAKYYGLGSVFIATAGTLFDAVPPLFG